MELLSIPTTKADEINFNQSQVSALLNSTFSAQADLQADWKNLLAEVKVMITFFTKVIQLMDSTKENTSIFSSWYEIYYTKCF